MVSVGAPVGEVDGGGSSVGDSDAAKVGVVLGELLGLIVDGLLLGKLVDGLVLGLLVVGLLDGDTDGAPDGNGVIAGKQSPNLSIPLVSSEQNNRFTMNGRLLSVSSILMWAEAPMQQSLSASGSKTQEHAVQ